MTTDESVRALLTRAARVVQVYSQPGMGPADDEARKMLDELAWLAAVRSLDAKPQTVAQLQQDVRLVVMAAWVMGRLAGLRET